MLDRASSVTVQSEQKDGRTSLSQSLLPSYSLEKSLAIAQTLYDNFGSKAVAPLAIAQALGLSPTSSSWRMLCGASIAFGLTSGGYNAKEIGLAPVGRAIVAPTYEGERQSAVVQAALTPKIMKSFVDRYDRAKLPPKEIGSNVLVTWGVPKGRAEQAFDLIVENGKFAGFIQEVRNGLYVSVDSVQAVAPMPPASESPQPESPGIDAAVRDVIGADGLVAAASISPQVLGPKALQGIALNINIQLVVPETTDDSVYEKFFAALKKNLLS